MAKKKKKRKGNPMRPVSDKHKLMRPKLKNGEFDIDWTLIMPDLGGTEYMQNESPLHISDEITELPVYQTLKKKYIKDTMTTEDYQEYKQRAEKIKENLELQFNKFLSSYTDDGDFVQTLCQDNTAIDLIDFREYVQHDNDLTAAANQIVNTPGMSDISMLWSTQDCVDVIITESLSYRIKRVIYDYINHEVRYCCIEYRKFRITDEITVKVPILTYLITTSIGTCLDMTKFVSGTNIPSSLESYKKESIHKKILECLSKAAPDENNFKAIRTGIMGIDGIESILGHMEKFHSHFSKEQYRLLREQMRSIYLQAYNQSATNAEKEEHIIASISVIISAIVVTNAYLKKNQISRPISDHIKYETDIVLENRPERKTRKLGNMIKIRSDKRPKAPDTEKIIKYHMPEWQCKGHLRHLKSGKIIEIKPHTCKRKCVDMSNIRSNYPKQGTNYIIQNPQKGENPDEH